MIGGNKYCSEKCHREYWDKKNKKVFAYKKCDMCGKDFMPVSSLNKYCSMGCKREADTLKRSNKPYTKKCKFCGVEFMPYTSLTKFCSANCRIDYIKSQRKRNWNPEKANAITGTANPAYRNGDYQRNVKRSSAGLRLFMKNAKEIEHCMIEDLGYIYCEQCGTSKSLRFERHHIIYRSEKPNHINLHDKENILIVCIKCHNELHKHKGLRNTIVESRKLNELFGNDVLNKTI